MMNNKKENYKKIKGISLVETIIAIGIFLIGITVFTLLFINGWKTNSFIMDEGESSFIASRGLNSIVKELRKARQGEDGSYLIESADSNDLVFYVDIDNDEIVERIHYFLDENEKKIKKGVIKPNIGNNIDYPSNDEVITDIIGYVENNSSDPIFYYYGKNYPIAPDSIVTPVSSEQLKDILLIKVNLWVDVKSNRDPDNINFESMAKLRNANNYVY